MINLKALGRILFAVPFLVFGINHLIMGTHMAGIVPPFIPGGVFWVYFTGLCLILASISIAINKFTKWSGILLGILMLIFSLTVHAPSIAKNPMGIVGLLKDLSLSGAAFLVSSVFGNNQK